MSLQANGAGIDAFKVLEANNPVFDEPTLAVLSGDTMFYIANSQWAAIDEKGKLAGDDKLPSHCFENEIVKVGGLSADYPDSLVNLPAYRSEAASSS
jgi:hypothetical protein